MELNIEIVAGIYPAVTLQELEDVKNSLLVLVVVSVVMEQCLKMEYVLIEAPAQVKANMINVQSPPIFTYVHTSCSPCLDIAVALAPTTGSLQSVD